MVTETMLKALLKIQEGCNEGCTENCPLFREKDKCRLSGTPDEWDFDQMEVWDGPAEEVQARWLRGFEPGEYRCSACGYRVTLKGLKMCNRCKRKMEVDE